MTSDSIADMLTRIRNANTAHHRTVEMPASKMKVEIARVLTEEGFVDGYEVSGEAPMQVLTVTLKPGSPRGRALSGLRRISRPGLRVYARKSEIPMTGRPAPKASPCATLAARRTPVKEPGPRPNAMASSIGSVIAASRSNSSTIGRICSVWPLRSSVSRRRSLSDIRSAHEHASVAVSSARILIPKSDRGLAGGAQALPHGRGAHFGRRGCLRRVSPQETHDFL